MIIFNIVDNFLSLVQLQDILDKVQDPPPQALIVDSIQTVYLRGVTGSAGNIMQVCSQRTLSFFSLTIYFRET